MKVTKARGKGKTYNFTDVTREELEYLYHVVNCNPLHCLADYYGVAGLVYPQITPWDVFHALKKEYKKIKQVEAPF